VGESLIIIIIIIINRFVWRHKVVQTGSPNGCVCVCVRAFWQDYCMKTMFDRYFSSFCFSMVFVVVLN